MTSTQTVMSSSRLGLPTFKAYSGTNSWFHFLHASDQAMECSDQKLDRSLTVGGLDELLDELQGSSYFVKKLSATNALQIVTSSSRNRCGQLSMPRKFVVEHGDKFRRAIELRSDLSSNKPWPYYLSFCTSREVPEVTFAGSRWGAFLTAHGLVQGDRLIFSLTAMSQFQVYIFNALGDPKGPQRLHTPMKWPLPVDCKTNRVDKFEDEVDTTAFSIDTPPELQEIHSEDLSSLPSFTRRLVAMNNYRLEFPKDFVAAYGDQLRGRVQLQGIREESTAKYDVKCKSYMGNGYERMYMRGAGWEDFVSENQLRFKQELVFTLTARSCFVVREVVSWSPHTGLNPGSVSARRLRALKSASSDESEQ